MLNVYFSDVRDSLRTIFRTIQRSKICKPTLDVRKLPSQNLTQEDEMILESKPQTRFFPNLAEPVSQIAVICCGPHVALQPVLVEHGQHASYT